MSNRVVHFEIQADDPKRAAEFYKKTFGWKIDQMMTAEKGGMDYWGLTTGPDGTPGINGGMYKRKSKDQQPTMAIETPSIDETIKKIEKAGGKITTPKHAIGEWGFMADFTDVEGNEFSLWESPEKK